MLDDLFAAYGNRFLVAAVGVSLAILCLFVVLWLLRHRAPSPFVRGGRNRQPRLQVLDAAAVDARRRIVLIRRDNVEHLVMIGGPTDLVIESGIGDERTYLSVPEAGATPLPEQQSTPAAIAEPVNTAPPPRPHVSERPAQQPPISQPRAGALSVRASALPTAAAAAAPSTPDKAPPAKPEPPLARQAPASDFLSAPEFDDDDTHSAKVEPPAPRAGPATAERPVEPQPSFEPATTPASNLLASNQNPEDLASERATPAASTVATTEEESVDDILEAARSRVLTPQAEPTRMPQEMPSPLPAPGPSASQPATAPAPRAPGTPSSDFERVLEEEMNYQLAGNMPNTPQRPLAPTVMPPRATAAPMMPVSPPLRPAATPVRPTATQPMSKPAVPRAANQQEPNLQSEIARIFGEMSVKRD